VIRILDAAVAERGSVPEFIRSDNGPEFVALAVQDWIARRGFKTLYIKPGSPWQNAHSESFNSRFRDEFLKPGSLRLRARSESARQATSAAAQPRAPAFVAGIPDPSGVFAQRSLAAASATLRQPPGCVLPTHRITTKRVSNTLAAASSNARRPTFAPEKSFPCRRCNRTECRGRPGL
jgi:transposase InsO family protein